MGANPRSRGSGLETGGSAWQEESGDWSEGALSPLLERHTRMHRRRVQAPGQRPGAQLSRPGGAVPEPVRTRPHLLCHN